VGEGGRGRKAAEKKEYQERLGDRRGEREAWVKVNMLSAFL
jgi:hypothetical protein